MCTAITLESNDGYHFFGRNMDLEYNFNQSVIFIPRKYPILNKITNEIEKEGYAILSMATMMENNPMLADGFNEHGLAVAGLNFPGYASYDKIATEGNYAIPVYNFMLWMLRNFKSIEQLEPSLNKVSLLGIPFLPNVPIATLHWIVYDKTGRSIVIEKQKDSFKVFENTVGILGNAPSFDWHITNLNHYAGLQSTSFNETKWHNQVIKPDGQGGGLLGLPGDSYPSSRFIRAAYLKSHAVYIDTLESTLSTFFHILDNLAFVDGTVVTKEGHQDITQYSSCMCLEQQVYYYKTYKNNQINAVSMDALDKDGSEVIIYPYMDTQSIHKQNY